MRGELVLVVRVVEREVPARHEGGREGVRGELVLVVRVVESGSCEMVVLVRVVMMRCEYVVFVKVEGNGKWAELV